MRQITEFVTKTTPVKERKTSKGYIYTFAVAINDREAEGITEWLQCAIYQPERRPELLSHSGELHFTGELQVRRAYNDRPQGLQLFGFFVEPVLGRVWRVGGKRKAKEKEEPRQSPEPVAYAAPEQSGPPFDEGSESIPF